MAENKKFGTKCIHAGVSPDPSTGAIMTPIFQTSTYVQKAPGDHFGFEYARTQNPTRNALQDSLASLENGKFGIAFGSGMAATDALAKLLSAGDEILSTNDLYGGTYRIFTKVFARLGIKSNFIDMTDVSSIEAHITDATKMIWVETPTNPMLSIIDIEAVAKIAKAKNILLVVDNTFCSPALQLPLDLGADIVIHSGTKYLGGHSDTVFGIIATADQKIADDLYFLQNTCGAVPGPQDCFLALRGIKTLAIRMERHCYNGEKVARFLKAHPKVKACHWPGFEDHPNHDIAKKQMSGFGGMISFALEEDSIEAANRVMNNTHLFQLAESLGGVESLIGHPATMTHAAIPLEERRKTGVLDSLIRLSIGIEDADDLIADLEHALAQ